MNKVMSASLAALMAIGAVIPASTTEADARHGRGRGLAIGAVIGALGVAAIASGANAHGYRSEYRGRRYCGRLARKCDYGHRWACRRYEDDCYGDY